MKRIAALSYLAPHRSFVRRKRTIKRICLPLSLIWIFVAFLAVDTHSFRRSHDNNRVRRATTSNSSCPDQSVWEKSTVYPPDLVDTLFNFDTCTQRAFVPLYIIGALYMFLALAIVCDDFFVPSLEVIIEKTHLPEDVAGATFMAAGGSAPELFTSMAGMMFSRKVDVGIGTIVGSAVFNVLFVIAVCAFGTYWGPTDKTVLELTWYPFTRDVTFYSIGLIMLIICFLNSEIVWYESVLLFSLYIVYCLYMIINRRVQEKLESLVRGKTINPDDEPPKLPETDEKPAPDSMYIESDIQQHTSSQDPIQASEHDEDDDDDGPVSIEWPKGKPWYTKMLFFPSVPLKLCMLLTIPDVKRGRLDPKTGERDKSSLFWWWGHPVFFITFINSILWIGAFSFFMVWSVERVAFLLGIDSAIMGLTILAAGTSIPDLITSYLVARKGFGDMALSSSIGSNLFDICIGLPIPWLLYMALNSTSTVHVNSDGLMCYILMLFVMLMAVFIAIIIFRWRLNLMMGISMMVLYIIFLCFAVLIGQNTLECPA